jgi:UDP-N-acetylmuramate dehydrogenase
MPDNIFKKLQAEFPLIQQKVSLKDYTSFKVGGPAKYFLVVKTKEELLRAIALAKRLRLKTFVLGGGTNVLAPDKGFNGLIIKVSLSGLSLVSATVIEAESGVVMKDLVNFSIKNNLAGLEWAGGLPGTFGGAVRGNAGAFGGEMKDSVFSVDILDSALKAKTLSHQQSQFAYRNSVVKKKGWTIISAKVKLKKGDKKALLKIANSRISYRKKFHPLEFPNAGSVFKNVPVKSLPKKFLPEFVDKIKQDPFPIIPTAWLIIGAGLTGKKVGRAQISKKHSNYIVNVGKAKASDIIKLIATVKKVVYKKYGVMLEPEVQYLN